MNRNFESRPWGDFKVLETIGNSKIKTLLVHPGKRISLQSHSHRDEYWVIIAGAAKITKCNKKIVLHRGDVIAIFRREKHRVENIGKIPLIIAEIQIGEYLSEDDIIRYEDDFGRECEDYNE